MLRFLTCVLVIVVLTGSALSQLSQAARAAEKALSVIRLGKAWRMSSSVALRAGARATAESTLAELDVTLGDVTMPLAQGLREGKLVLETRGDATLLKRADDGTELLRMQGMEQEHYLKFLDAIKELERCALLGAKGVGELHPDTQGFDITDRDQVSSLMEAAKDLGLIVLLHTSEPVGHLYPGKGKTTPEKLWSFIQNFPDNSIVCAHWGGGLPFYALMPEVADAMANVYFDSAASPFLYQPAVFKAVVDILGPEKVLLGTDYPLLPQRRLLAQVEKSPLTPHDKELILGQNAKDLLGI